MEFIPLTRASQLIHAAATLEGQGLSPERILRRAGLPMWHFCGPEELIPSRDTYTFMHYAAHFSRAFRRWAGITPREFRGQQLDA